MCFIKVGIFGTFYALLFILIFIQLDLILFIKKTLITLGEYSMPMWMTHTFFSAYLFHDFIYGFKYPLLIYIVLIIISLIVSIPIMMISRRIIRVARL